MNNVVYILGIHDGHNCGATVTRNGQVLASVSEERLTGKKNEVGYPNRSIEEVINISGIRPEDLGKVAYASNFMHSEKYLTNLEDWYCVGLEHQKAEEKKPKDYLDLIFHQRRKEREQKVETHLSVKKTDIHFVEHHLAHLAAAYYCSPNWHRHDKMLGLTCDGAGDNLSATVSICTSKAFERLSSSSRHASLGKIYSRMTMLLGMKPWEHEYKLMGMAPYADPQRSDLAAEKLRSLLTFSEDGLSFEQASDLSMNYCYEYLKKEFERVRFDVASSAVQKFTEEMLVKWVKNAITKTGVPDIICGGGVFMNVKANMLISELPEVRSMYVMPTAGDESLSIGACLHTFHSLDVDSKFSESAIDHLYLGADYTEDEELAAIGDIANCDNLAVQHSRDTDSVAAKLLAQGHVVARCKGRMEWGARSLGNRSILAPADDYRVVDKINAMIKMRDFWMPFAPAIMEERQADYFDDPKKIEPEFMTFAFPVKHKKREELIAGSHPRDHTIRPQVVKSTTNPDFHALMKSYEVLTGLGVILNTSFNLHGHPIVRGPKEAIHVLKSSGLKHLILNNHHISKFDED
jgi:carbamoyltransferase